MDGMADTEIPTTTFPDGRTAVALAQGTWNMGDDRAARSTELDALRAGLDAGLTAIDTAEMYGSGRSEELVGEAIAGRRDEVFLISKVLPSNASRRGTGEAARRSLARLGTDRLDLYLLHWRGSHPLADTVAAMQELVEEGLIRAWGVSNLDGDDLDELAALPGGDAAQTDQVLYNLAQRGPEHDVIPWARDRRMPVMAYSPLDQGRLVTDPTLADLAAPLGVSAGQLALAWVVRQAPHVFATAKAATPAHVAENRAALDLVIPDETLAALDRAFPGPSGTGPLAMY
jgi:diketogulonate reductase-like aldo/keto reductase